MDDHIDILIVDDNEIVIKSMVKIITELDLSYEIASDGEMAFNKVKTKTYRLILCDILMPKLDGFQFIESLNNMNSSIPVIIVSGYSTLENIVKSFKTGAIDFVFKPFTIDELHAAIQRGLKYKKIKISASESLEGTLVYVPTPANYFSFGYGTWMKHDHSGVVLVGITDLFLKVIGDTVEDIVTGITGNDISQGEQIAQIKTKDGFLHSVWSPVSGKIIEINNDVLEDLSILEKDPYFNGWFFRIIPNSLEHDIAQLTPYHSN